MELYTMDENFQPLHAIDDILSAIWVERFGKSGDVNIVANPSEELVTKLAEGTFLQCKGTDEIMLLETSFIEDGVLKASGTTLDGFLNNRHTKATANIYNNKSFNMVGKPGEIMTDLVFDICIDGGLESSYASLHPDFDQLIVNLTLGDVDVSGDDVTIAIPLDKLYPILEQIASTYNLGFSLYLDSFTPPDDYSLKFKTYSGIDVSDEVKFSPNMDTLTDVKFLRSMAEYRNVCMCFASNLDASSMGAPPVAFAFADAAAETSVSFDRRTLLVEESNYQMVGADWPLPDAELLAALEQKAKDALANNNYVKIVDGQVIPSIYTYGVDYNLGDLVGLTAYETITKARITEYIRSQDAEGEKEYPTVSVIDD